MASGISYRKKIDKTEEEFNMLRCTKVRKIMSTQSPLDVATNWNMHVQKWLKYYVYMKLVDREVPRNKQ